jgi:antirestriction protein ArdC
VPFRQKHPSFLKLSNAYAEHGLVLFNLNRRADMSTSISSVYEEVTRQILVELEQGVAPWIKPWCNGGNSELPRNGVSQRQYSGVNILLLWNETLAKGYQRASWLTFRQSKELGGFIRKGEKASHIVYASSYIKHEKDQDTGEDIERQIPFLKFYSVFNVEQIEGLPEHLYAVPDLKSTGEANDGAEQFLKALGASVRHIGNHAGYVPALDYIFLPKPDLFESMAHYYATSLHEHAHWSGHKNRLDRNLSGRFGDQSYAAEELVAELTAAFLCAHLSIPGELRHAEYVGSWIKLFQDDKRAIFTAASKATEAADYLRNL